MALLVGPGIALPLGVLVPTKYLVVQVLGLKMGNKDS